MIVKNSLIVASGSVISRISGYIRDVLIAAILGTGWTADAYFIARKLPSLFRRILAEGAFSSAFIPIYSNILHEYGEKEARNYVARIFVSFIMIFLSIVLLVVFFIPQLLDVVIQGFEDEHQRKILVEMTRITMPYTFFICIMCLLSCLLNVNKKFFFASFVPSIVNICTIFAILISKSMPQEIVAKYIAYSIFYAGILQCSMLFYATLKNKFFRICLPEKLFNKDILKLIFRMFPVAIGAGAFQINALISTGFASKFPSLVSYLYYADRIVSLPISIIGTALYTVLLPNLSYYSERKDKFHFDLLNNKSFEYASLLAAPITIFIFSFSQEIVSILFQRGLFTMDSVIATSQILKISIITLPAYVFAQILLSVFYANHDTKIPVRIGIMLVILNFCFNYMFIDITKILTIPIASNIYTYVEMSLLIYIAIKKSMITLHFNTIKMIFLSYICAVLSIFLLPSFSVLINSNKLICFLTKMFTYIAIYVVMILVYKFVCSKPKNLRNA